MPVHKHRTVEEMTAIDGDLQTPGQRLAELAELIALMRRLHPWRFPPGVYKSASVEAANARREAFEATSAVARE